MWSSCPCSWSCPTPMCKLRILTCVVVGGEGGKGKGVTNGARRRHFVLCENGVHLLKQCRLVLLLGVGVGARGAERVGRGTGGRRGEGGEEREGSRTHAPCFLLPFLLSSFAACLFFLKNRLAMWARHRSQNL